MTRETLSVSFQIISWLMDKLTKEKQITPEDRDKWIKFMEEKGFHFTEAKPEGKKE